MVFWALGRRGGERNLQPTGLDRYIYCTPALGRGATVILTLKNGRDKANNEFPVYYNNSLLLPLLP
jgi:hypothetical protein